MPHKDLFTCFQINQYFSLILELQLLLVAVLRIILLKKSVATVGSPSMWLAFFYASRKSSKFSEDPKNACMWRKIRVYDNTLRHEAISKVEPYFVDFFHFSVFHNVIKKKILWLSK